MRLVTPEEFDKLAKAEKDHWWHRGMRTILFRTLDPILAGRDIQTVLEAGWGTGYLARVLQARYDSRVFPLAVAGEGQRGIERMAESDIAALPFPDRTFDAVFLLDVLSHVTAGQADRVLGEITRVLAPKGLLVVRAAALEVFRVRHPEATSERHRFTRQKLIAPAERHGLRILRSSYVNAVFAPVALAKFRVLELALGRPVPVGPVTVPRWLDRMCSVRLGIEAAWLGLGLNLPVGQTVILIAERER